MKKVAHPPQSTGNKNDILNLLPKIKKSFEMDEIDYPTYKRIVIGFMQDYINSFDDHTKMDYIFHSIKDSKEAIYLDENIYKELQNYVISVVSGTDKEKPTSRS